MPVDSQAAGISLHMAARDGNAKMVRAILARKELPADIEERDLLGDTALLKAARYGHLEVVNIMIQAGADLRVQDNKGWSCLHSSISNNHKDVFLALLSRNQGPPVDIKFYIFFAREGEARTLTDDTPLHMAAYHNRKWAVDTLLRLGGDALASARNNDGSVPHEVARNENLRDLLCLAVRQTKADTPSSEGRGADSDGDGRLPSSNDSSYLNLNNSERDGDRGDNLGEGCSRDSSLSGSSELRVSFGYDEPPRTLRSHGRTVRLDGDSSTSSSCGSPRDGECTRDVGDKREDSFEEDSSDSYESE